MKNPQVINLNEDSVLAFDGDSIIDDTDQLPLALADPKGHGLTDPISIEIYFYDLIAGELVIPVDTTMVYNPHTDFWMVDVSTLTSYLEDRIKYVGRVVEIGSTNNMRPFKIDEFCVDNDSFEATWMRLPYQVETNLEFGEAYIRWYADTAFTTLLFQAQAYQGGTGTIYATTPANVTHRGPIVAV